MDPLPTFREMQTHVVDAACPTIVISTELLPPDTNQPGEWWYCAPETGQHVSFYTHAALQVIAEELRMNVATNGLSFHVFSSRPVSPALLRTISSRKGRGLCRLSARLLGRTRRSLTHSDANRVLAHSSKR